MALLTWSPMFSVGVQIIDDQHKKLLDLANSLNDEMAAGRGDAALAKTFIELANYTQYHFSTEERLMSQHSYSASAEHKKQHADLIASVTDLKKRFEKGEKVLTAQVMTFLRDWLMKHIMNTDKALGRELNQKGVK